jgi:glutathione peroxidase-family protein
MRKESTEYFQRLVKIYQICTLLFTISIFSLAKSDYAFAALPDLTLENIDGQPVKLSSFQGQVLLIVNTASLCGFTSQYKDLERLQLDYQNRGFTVLGFPSNDFKNQEPSSNQEIKSFCTSKFHVTFPLFAKNSVTGEKIQPLFKFLTSSDEEQLKGEVSWNFEKFLIDRTGRLRARFGSFVNPMNNKITQKLEELLNEKP